MGSDRETIPDEQLLLRRPSRLVLYLPAAQSIDCEIAQTCRVLNGRCKHAATHGTRNKIVETNHSPDLLGGSLNSTLIGNSIRRPPQHASCHLKTKASCRVQATVAF